MWRSLQLAIYNLHVHSDILVLHYKTQVSAYLMSYYHNDCSIWGVSPSHHLILPLQTCPHSTTTVYYRDIYILGFPTRTNLRECLVRTTRDPLHGKKPGRATKKGTCLTGHVQSWEGHIEGRKWHSGYWEGDICGRVKQNITDEDLPWRRCQCFAPTDPRHSRCHYGYGLEGGGKDEKDSQKSLKFH